MIAEDGLSGGAKKNPRTHFSNPEKRVRVGSRGERTTAQALQNHSISVLCFTTFNVRTKSSWQRLEKTHCRHSA
jgi:hypothetical protein